MALTKQNKPPLNPSIISTPTTTSTRSPPMRKAGGSEVRKFVGSGRLLNPIGGHRIRQDPPTTTMKDDLTSNASSDCAGGGEVELNRELVDEIINEKMKKFKSKFDYKGKSEYMTEYTKKLRLCIKWFQQLEESYLSEQEKLGSLVEYSNQKCIETEDRMRNIVDELDAQIDELRMESTCLEERLAKVESEKMAAIESHKNEREDRHSVERSLAILTEDFERSKQELKRANTTIEALNDACRTSQEYNTGLQQYNATLQRDCEAYKMSLKRLEQEKAAIFEDHITVKHRHRLLQEELASLQDSRDDTIKQRDILKAELDCLRSELKQAKDDRDNQHLLVQNLTAELVKCKEFTGESLSELDKLTIKFKALEETCSSQREEIQTLHSQLAVANEKLKMADLATKETRTEYDGKKRLALDLENRLREAEFKIVEAEMLRKKLHNTILELKGNIRVFCRVRPTLPDDGAGLEASVVCYPTSTESLGQGIDLLQTGQKHQFSFDKVFTQESSQQDVFTEISQLVQSALDGYKVCIFAYGQTGSGKTYTMMGRPEIAEQKGLIPRSIEQIFQSSQSLISRGWKYKMQASMLEIYNETVRDLLSTNRGGSLDSSSSSSTSGKQQQYTIKHDANGNTHVSDLTIVDVCSLEEVSSLLHQAAQSRSVGKTQMNEESSRSHFVFTLQIIGVNESTEQQVHGILNLVDLAGSERLSKSGSTGDRLKETLAINKSLSSLGDVIFALAKREDHVPFRNSKLTYLLQPCLGGDSKTLMFVNLSPDPSSVGESLCSLRFAARVNSCEIGVPRRQTSLRSSESRQSYG